VLVALVEADGRMLRSAELADSISWERSRVSHHVGRMEARGLVERQACPTDSRGAELRMTDAGLAAIRLASGSHLRGLKSLFADALTDRQIDDLGEIVDAIARHLEVSDSSAVSDD
jgi:DNA-binding MarR family transcriptional regulator